MLRSPKCLSQLSNAVVCASCRGVRATLPGFFRQQGSPLTDPENKGKRQTGVNFDNVGSWNNRLDLEVNIEQSIRRGKIIPEIKFKDVAKASLLGRRKVNEDRWMVDRLANNIMLFGIFDGHGSMLAADYTTKHLKEHLLYWLENGEWGDREPDLEVVLKKSFLELNNKFSRYLFQNLIDDDPSMVSGTTATVCLLRNDWQLVIAHVGDSRALLCRDGKAVKLTEPHSPENEAECERIEKCGGHISWSSVGKPRVNGKLQMTRSIGDVELKPYGVIAEPDTKVMAIQHSSDAFLVLSTDGVTDVLNSQEVLDIISSCQDPHEAARFVTDQALLFGSEDNTTVVIIPFGSWGKFASKKFHFGFSRTIVGGRC